MGRRRLDELAPENIDEIAEGKIPTNCRACGKKQTIYVRLHGTTTPNCDEILTGNRTHSFIGVCPNRECFRSIDAKKVKTWVPKDSTVGIQ